MGGGWWVWNHYEIRERESETPELPMPAYRPTGHIEVTSFENGTVWRLDADSVTGPRDARQVWIVADHSKDTSVPQRETKTLYRIDCDTTAYRTLSVVEYGADGKVTGNWGADTFADEENFPPPGTHISAVVAEGCRPGFDKAATQAPIQAIPPPAPVARLKQD